jgi:hypothetical protein
MGKILQSYECVAMSVPKAAVPEKADALERLVRRVHKSKKGPDGRHKSNKSMVLDPKAR